MEENVAEEETLDEEEFAEMRVAELRREDVFLSEVLDGLVVEEGGLLDGVVGEEVEDLGDVGEEGF